MMTDPPTPTNRLEGADIPQLLRAVPKERLIDILAEDVAPRELGQRIAQLRHSLRPPRNVTAALYSLTVDQLVELILAVVPMDESRAWEEFHEYRFSARPSLYLRSLSGPVSASLVNLANLESRIDKLFEDLNAQLLEQHTDPPAREFHVQSLRCVDGLVELTYVVEHRVDLVQRDLRPRIEYTTVLGAVWVNPDRGLCLINTTRSSDADHLSDTLAAALEIEGIYPITLTDSLLERIVEERSIRTGAFARAIGDGDGPHSIRYGNPNLASLSSYQELRAGGRYRPTYGYYRFETAPAELTDLGVGLTRRSGRIWIPYALSRTTLVSLANWLMQSIGERQTRLLEADLAGAIATREAAIADRLPGAWKRPEARESIEALLGGIASCLRHGLERHPLDVNPHSLARALHREWLAITVEGFCECCKADVLLTCPHCVHSRFDIKKDEDLITCRQRQEALELANLPPLSCECGQVLPLDPNPPLTLFPGGNLIEALDALLRVVDAQLSLARHAFLIEGDEIRLLRDRTAARVLQLNDIAEFGDLKHMDEHADLIRQGVQRRMVNGEAGREKCTPRTNPVTGRQEWPCHSCSPQPHVDRECLRTVVVDRLGNGKIEPHTGTEVADLVFKVTVDGYQLTALAFGKRMKKPNAELRSTNSEGRELMAQVWQWHDKESFEVIAVLSSQSVAQNLRVALEDMARYGRKSVLYLDGPAIERLLAANIADGLDRGPGS